jgi:hypothetical protein
VFAIRVTIIASVDLCISGSVGRGKSYGGHDDVQTVFGQAILVAEFSPKKIQIISFAARLDDDSFFKRQHTNTQATPTLHLFEHKQEETIHYGAVHLLVYAAISPIHKVGEIMHSFL